VLPWKDPNIPLEVTNKIFEYLTWKRVNKFKEVSTMAKTYIEQNKAHLCFKSTMECLNEITKQINGKENKNKKDVQVEESSEVQGDRRGRVENRIHRQRLRQKTCLLSLGMKSSPARECIHARRTNGGCAQLGLDRHQE
jgi:hypothetical protein